MPDSFGGLLRTAAIFTAPFVLAPYMITQLPKLFADLNGADAGKTPPVAAPPSPAAPPPPAPPQPADTPFDWTPVGYIVGILAVIAIVVALVWLSWRVIRRGRARAAEREALRRSQIDWWNIGVTAYAEASDGLWEFEKDPMSVYITRPLLADISEPASADFYTAYGLATERHAEAIPTDDAGIEAFVTAAKQARDTFVRADDNARRKARLGYTSGGRQFTEHQRNKVDQARKLLTNAFDEGATPQEARAAHAKALELLDAVGVQVPERLVSKLTLSLEQAHRPALSAGVSK